MFPSLPNVLHRTSSSAQSSATSSWHSRGEGYVALQAVLMLGIVLLPGMQARHSLKARRPVGLPLLLTGLGLTVWGARSLGRNLTPLPEPMPQTTLVESGAYGIARHPIYGGLLLMALGWATYQSSRGALLLTAGLGALFEAKARREERRLTERFPTYGAYQRRVRKFIPGMY